MENAEDIPLGPPVYTALSYTWGDSKRSHRIFVNYPSFPVTESLETMLRHFQYETGIMMLWID